MCSYLNEEMPKLTNIYFCETSTAGGKNTIFWEQTRSQGGQWGQILPNSESYTNNFLLIKLLVCKPKQYFSAKTKLL